MQATRASSGRGRARRFGFSSAQRTAGRGGPWARGIRGTHGSTAESGCFSRCKLQAKPSIVWSAFLEPPRVRRHFGGDGAGIILFQLSWLGRAAVAIVGRAPCAGRRRPRRQRQARQHPRPRESKVPIGMRTCCASNESLGARMLTATWLLSRVSTVPGQCPVSARYSARSVPGHSARSVIVEECAKCILHT